MLKVYCDVCGEEIKEDGEGEGIDWAELQLRRSENNVVTDGIDNICRECESIVKQFLAVLRDKRMEHISSRKGLSAFLAKFVTEE